MLFSGTLVVKGKGVAAGNESNVNLSTLDFML